MEYLKQVQHRAHETSKTQKPHSKMGVKIPTQVNPISIKRQPTFQSDPKESQAVYREPFSFSPQPPIGACKEPKFHKFSEISHA